MAATASSAANTSLVLVSPSRPVSMGRGVTRTTKGSASHVKLDEEDSVPHPRHFGVSASVGHDHWANDVLQVVKPLLESSSSEAPPQPERNLAEEKILERKKKFHAGRPLELKNLPEDCTEQNIRDAFPDLTIVGVTIERHDGRYKPGAKLTLDNPEVLDSWPKSRQNVFVKNKEVSVCVGNSDGWLCVAKLPLEYTEDQFLALAGSYGKVREAFLMISELNGESKGYGLVKYLSSDAAAQARHLLDGRQVNNDYFLDCDWLNSGHITFASLHSKALFIDHLPPNYRELGEFRKIFSVVKNPPYCQIAMPQGVIQDWGLVEFFDHEDTEVTQKKMNGFNLLGSKIRVHYCIPGVNAINIYMQAVNAPSVAKKKALMNDTPSANVYSQLQKLAQQNPTFAQNLQNIIQEQIQTLSSGRANLSSSKIDTTQADNTTKANEVSILPDTTLVSATPSLNSNAQAALMILLTAQMQAQAGEASLLQNNQVVGILQNLVNQAHDPNPGARTLSPSTDSFNELVNNPELSPLFGNLRDESNSIGKRPSLLGKAPSHGPPVSNAAPPPSPKEGTAKTTQPMVANNLNNLLNTQNLSQLLGSLNSAKGPPPNSVTMCMAPPPPPPPPNMSMATPPTSGTSQMVPRRSLNLNGSQRPVLLNDPHSTQRSSSGLLQNPYYIISQQQQIPLMPGLPMTSPTMSNFYSSPIVSTHQGSFGATNPFFYQAACSNPVMNAFNQSLLSSQVAAAVATNHHQQQQQQQLLLQPPPSQMTSAYGLNPFQFNPALFSPSPSSSQMSGSSVNGSPFTSPSSGIGNKRKLPIPPSPEQSPEGPYIGQHSQGIGGHYADSYWRKKTKFN